MSSSFTFVFKAIGEFVEEYLQRAHVGKCYDQITNEISIETLQELVPMALLEVEEEAAMNCVIEEFVDAVVAGLAPEALVDSEVQMREARAAEDERQYAGEWGAAQIRN